MAWPCFPGNGGFPGAGWADNEAESPVFVEVWDLGVDGEGVAGRAIKEGMDAAGAIAGVMGTSAGEVDGFHDAVRSRRFCTRARGP